MKRIQIHFLVDILAFIAFLLLTTTGVLMHYILPPGSGRFMTIWGLDRHDWGGIHYWVAVTLFVSLTVHLFLNWHWIVNVVRGHDREKSGWRVALGIVGLLALLGLMIAPLVTPVEQSTRSGGQHQYGKGDH